MPGFADLFADDKLFNKSIAMPIASEYSSAAAIVRAGVAGMAKRLKKRKTRFQTRTLERIAVWALMASEPTSLAEMLTKQWKQLAQVGLADLVAHWSADKIMAGE